MALIELRKDGRLRSYNVKPTVNLHPAIQRGIDAGWEVTPDTLEAFNRYFDLADNSRPTRRSTSALRKPKGYQFKNEAPAEPQPCNVWYAIPTANEELANRCFAAWGEMGYKTAAYDNNHLDLDCDCVMRGEYHGYPAAVNALCRELDHAEIIVTGGDDVFPDPHKTADEIAAEFHEHFPDGFGVMQPIGDKYVGTDKICGSPWMGMGFIRRINGGKGPFWEEYTHFFCDEEMYHITKALGILWQRKDLTQYHNHHSRAGRDRTLYQQRESKRWNVGSKLFYARKKAGFPGHGPT